MPDVLIGCVVFFESSESLVGGVASEGSVVSAQILAAGELDSKEACWQRVLQRCQSNLHVVFAMSPVGETLQRRCRDFPALVSNTIIDWFDPWPESALQSVATTFLQVGAMLPSLEPFPCALRRQTVDRVESCANWLGTPLTAKVFLQFGGLWRGPRSGASLSELLPILERQRLCARGHTHTCGACHDHHSVQERA